MILYDMTKLLAKALDRTPTGIERIDYQYAKYFLNYHIKDLIFVSQRRGRMYVVRTPLAKEIIGDLGQRWDMEPPKAEERYAKRSVKTSDCFEYDVPKTGQIGDILGSLARESRRKTPKGHMFAGRLRDRVRQGREIESLVFGHFGWHSLKSNAPFIKTVVLIIVCILPYKMIYYLNNSFFELIGALLAVTKWLRMVVGVDNWPATYRVSVFLTRLLTRSPGGACAYFNISQAGLSHYGLFSQLRDIRSMDFAFFLHDFLPIEFPEYFKKRNYPVHHQRLKVAFEFGTHFVLNSRDTQKAMVRYASENNTRTNTIKNAAVIHPGVGAIFLEKNRTDASIASNKRSFFVIVGTVEPRKNHILLLCVWESLAKDGRGETPTLVIVGRRGWENENVVEMLEQCLEVRDYIVELPGIGDRILSELLKRCCALLCPSIAEGWGMPITEALAMGTPVICSDIPIFHESGQGVPEYLNPTDGVAWKEMVRNYAVPGSAERKAQLSRLANFRPPTWKEHFSRLESFVRLPGQ